MSTKTNICCFIHSTNIAIHGISILEKLINMLSETLLHQMDFIYINNIGDEIDTNHFQHISEKIHIMNYSSDLTLFENCTLRQLYFFSTINPEYKILYLHTKGVTHQKTSIFYLNVIDWTNFMLHCLVQNGDSCIELLDNYDCIGCNYLDQFNEIPLHYKGNFWWANANYINTLSTKKLVTRHDAEFWIFRNKPAFINIHTSTRNSYDELYPLIEYKDIVAKTLTFYKQHIYHKCTIIHLKICPTGNGLCNQLYKIINCIVDIIHNKKYNKTHHIITIDSFNKHALQPSYCPIDEILDIPRINNMLQQYNILIYASNKVKLEHVRIEYGIHGIHVNDITDIIKKHGIINDTQIIVKKDISLNSVSIDPVPNVRKNLYVYYNINGISYSTSIEEWDSRVLIPIQIDLNKENDTMKDIYSNSISSESKKNIFLFNKILCGFQFHASFYKKTNEFINTFRSKYTQYSVIHLRNEEDAIPFWGTINKMKHNDFEIALNMKYISIINKYFIPSATSVLIFLTSKIDNNPVIEYVKQRGWNYIFIEKIGMEREIDAINDLLIAQCCNSVFIGNYNPTTYHGSTFSYMIANTIKSNVKKVLLDLDNIITDEYIL